MRNGRRSSATKTGGEPTNARFGICLVSSVIERQTRSRRDEARLLFHLDDKRATARRRATDTHPRAWLCALVAGEGHARAARSGAGRARRIRRASAADDPSDLL